MTSFATWRLWRVLAAWPVPIRLGPWINKDSMMNPRPSSQSDDYDSRRFASSFVASDVSTAQGALAVVIGGDFPIAAD